MNENEGSSLIISSPKQLTKTIHANVLQQLRKALAGLKEIEPKESEIQKMRIRNWLFVYEDGTPLVDVILDKGYAQGSTQEAPYFADTSLTFEECSQIHKYVLETTALDAISDDVHVRFGSPGAEPTLYDPIDYEASIGNMVRLEAWVGLAGRNKFSMIIVDILKKEGNSVVVLAEGLHRFEIPLEDVKSATTLPFHPASKSVKMAKSKKIK